MLFKDEQADVNRFIVGQEPAVAQTPSPLYPSVMETVYTRQTRLGDLIKLTKRAIELHSR